MTDLKFEKLLPDNNVDISSYEEALDFALNNKMTNVALSGPYGAGKSSVIETYKKKRPEKNYMHISLSHFDGSKEIDTQILEGKIINQLLHQIEYKKIPQTIFKAKENASRFTISVTSIVLLLILLSGFITFKFSTWKSFIEQLNIGKLGRYFINDQIHVIVAVFFFCSIIYLTFRFVSAQLNQKLFKKIMLKGNEIEIFKDSEESYFDKFMNDVIYLFINSEKDIIIFEDLDRFDDPTIYERLHEINTLINKRLSIKDISKKLVFIYLIKDDTFKSKDRAKFFDMIIPIVPVIDASNSFDKFLSIFEESNVKEDFDIQTLKKISLYIDDMRLLKNINNEYLIYKQRLSSITLDYNKLLAMITYKNLFPEDFSLFQSGVGYINKVINRKSYLIDEKKREIENKVDEINADIQSAKKEMLNNINELDAIYLSSSPQYYFTVNGKTENDYSNRSEFIKAIKENNYEVFVNKPQVNYYSLQWNPEKINLLETFEAFKSDENYKKRLKKIEDKNKIEQLEQEKTRLMQEQMKIEGSNLSLLLNNVGNNFFEVKEIFNQKFHYLFSSQYFPLIIFLLREGLIDENYSDYLTYFYENSLQKEDKEFLRGIYDRSPKALTYELKNLELIISNLVAMDIITYKIKNTYLAKYLFINSYQYTDYVKNTITIMQEEKNNDYLLSLYQESSDHEDLRVIISVVLSLWPTVIENVISKSTHTREELEFVYALSSFTMLEGLKINNIDNMLANHIGNREIMYLNKLSLSEQISLLKKFASIGVKYTNLISTKVGEQEIKEVVKLRLFTISKDNLQDILDIYSVNYTEEEFLTSNISLLAKTNPEKIYDYFFREEIANYINAYLDFGSTKLVEDSRFIVKILNESEIGIDLSKKLLDRIYFTEPLEDISIIENKELWDILLENKNLEITGNNILHFYKEKEDNITEEIVQAINAEDVMISFTKDLDSIEDVNVFFNAIANNANIVTKQYISMLKSLNRVYIEGFSLSVSREKIKNLIQEKIIKLTQKNLYEVIEKYPENIIDFVLIDIDVFCDIFSNEDIYNHNILLNLIDNPTLTDIYRKKLIDISDQDISIVGKEFSTGLQLYILKNKYSENDLQLIVENYSTFDKTVKAEIKNISIENIDSIIDKQFNIDTMLLDDLLVDEQFQGKQKLFSWYIQKYNDKQVIHYIEKLNFPNEFISVLNRKRPKFINSDLNNRILEDYRRREWITKIDTEDGMLRVQGRKILPL
ncbi:hypothetical protein [Enterococcus thailandicus]|uniref:YobI family P-loop NTPase n=1 Tax=Enterococcus thailandicus TaxID=417368 RepID=UPI0022EBE1A9|nr:hypothetical protein [Enterococcus thailandicus]MDA3965289.1 hypothetical protein [Enterococcus thailandicus]